jgi:hypothetical protein
VAFEAVGKMTPNRTGVGSVPVNNARALDWLLSRYEILA